MLYISVYQLIKQHIEENTDLGKKLLATKKPRDIKLQQQAKDEFQELEYSAVHFDLDNVIQIVKDTILQKRTNQKYILLEGLCNNSKLIQEEDQLELRYMDEFFHIEKHIGEVYAIVSLQFQYEKEILEEHEVVYEEFPPEPVEEPKPKAEGEEGEEEPPAAEEGDGD